MATKAGSIYTEIRARLDKYEKDLAKARGVTEKSANRIQRHINKISFRSATKSMASFSKNFMRLQTLFAAGLAGFGAGKVASSFIDVAESFEQMEAKLDILTKGRGAEKLKEINDWALTLPISTEQVTQAFVRMTAMGLNPTMGRMQALANVAAVMGDDVLPRLSLQLGQAAAKGKIMQQDINIMGEAGIDVAKHLRDAFGMTVQELQSSGIDIQTQLQAIFDGMARDFDGSIERMAKNWRGLKAIAKSYFTEIQRQVMAAGIFEELKKQLAGINDEMKKWLETNSDILKIRVPEYVEKIKSSLMTLWEMLTYDPDIIKYGVIGLLVFGKKGAAVLGGLSHFGNVITVQAKAFKALIEGQLSFSDIATANYTELKKLVEGIGQLNDGLAQAHGNANRMGDALQKSHKKANDSIPLPNKTGRVDYTTTDEAWKELKSNKKVVPVLTDLWATYYDKQTQMAADAAAEKAKILESIYPESNKKVVPVLTDLWATYNNEQVQEAARMASEKAETLRQWEEENKKVFNGMVELTERTAWSMQETFSDVFFDAMDGKLTSLADYFNAILDSIKRSVADIASQSLIQGMFGDLSKAGGGGGWISNIFSPDKKMASGGYLGEGVRGIGTKTGQSYEFHPNEFVMPASKMGGGVQVDINVVNNLGQEADVKKTTSWVSPDNMVADIVLNKKMTSRSFRQGMA